MSAIHALQVLVSIQSMIFVEDPYFNEPGFENTAGSQSGRAHSEGYNARVRRDTLLHALLPALKKPPAAFKDALLYALSPVCSEFEFFPHPLRACANHISWKRSSPSLWNRLGREAVRVIKS